MDVAPAPRKYGRSGPALLSAGPPEEEQYFPDG